MSFNRNLFETIYILVTFFYILLYFRLFIVSFPNINQYTGKIIPLVRIITDFWFSRFQGLIPLFYKFNFAPIFSILIFKSFRSYLKKLKNKLC